MVVSSLINTLFYKATKEYGIPPTMSTNNTSFWAWILQLLKLTVKLHKRLENASIEYT